MIFPWNIAAEIMQEAAYIRDWGGQFVVPHGELARPPQGWSLNNLEDMAAAKIAAFEDRAEIKDMLDRWHLSRQTPLSRLFGPLAQNTPPISA